MANCTKLFKDFNKIISPTAIQFGNMRTSRIKLEEKITAKFIDQGLKAPTYYTQGSSAKDMNTIIIKADKTYDVDRGVYLPEKPEVGAETIQKYIYEAVKDHTNGGTNHKQKCIRVLFKADYDIDFVAYYEVEGESFSYLANKSAGWIKDDPSKMITWFVEKKDANGQLVRIVKYIKAWASEHNNTFKMPSGIALTVWAASNFKAKEEKDDESLLLTLQGIKSSIGSNVYCTSPVVPYDNLVAKRDDEQKRKFLKSLELLCEDAQNAVNLTNQLEASRLWRKHLGVRFPLGSDEDIDKKEKALMASVSSIFSNNAKLSSLGVINESFGVSHKNHRNFGR